jgi:hypothetical protein
MDGLYGINLTIRGHIGLREFRRLNRAEALRLAQAKGLDMPDQRDFSLAELYCARTEPTRIGQQQSIGFA